MTTNPYSGLPEHQFWRRAVAGVEPFRFDPVTTTRFTIGRDEPVATAGSCFAQHISSRLTRLGFNYFVPEAGEHLPDELCRTLNYGIFSARTGNVYTTRQLLQLYQEVFEGRAAIESVWQTTDGRWVDALRPQITPGGYSTQEEVRSARAAHLGFVRRMFEDCDIFVFTMGLTETWRSRIDGTVYPLAPGVSGGSFDVDRHEFANLDVYEVMNDLDEFLRKFKTLNPGVKVILTVSPVPLIATYEPRNVLVATTYSKSVLRVAADAAYRKHDWVEYFPSFEIITGNYSNSRYFEADYRGINSIGVDHAMRSFLEHYTDAGTRADAATPKAQNEPAPARWMNVDGIICDEEAIDQIRV